MQLPKKITPCPIADVSIEIRFETSTPQAAVFGIIYKDFHDEFQKVENLPILQIPENIRLNDPNLQFRPFYRISSDKYSIQIGPNVISLGPSMGYKNSYPGWEELEKDILEIFRKLEKSNVIEKVIRSGMRYLNFFKFDIFQEVQLQIEHNKSLLSGNNTVLRTEIEDKGYWKILQLTNSAELSRDGNQPETGSIIDIDVSMSGEHPEFFKSINEHFDTMHNLEKELFFNLLSPESINKLNPQY